MPQIISKNQSRPSIRHATVMFRGTPCICNIGKAYRCARHFNQKIEQKEWLDRLKFELFNPCYFAT